MNEEQPVVKIFKGASRRLSEPFFMQKKEVRLLFFIFLFSIFFLRSHLVYLFPNVITGCWMGGGTPFAHMSYFIKGKFFLGLSVGHYPIKSQQPNDWLILESVFLFTLPISPASFVKPWKVVCVLMGGVDLSKQSLSYGSPWWHVDKQQKQRAAHLNTSPLQGLPLLHQHLVVSVGDVKIHTCIKTVVPKLLCHIRLFTL